MNGYRPSIPRIVLGMAAVAMTALTVGVSVIMPAGMDSDAGALRPLAAATVRPPALAGPAIGSVGPDVAVVHAAGLSALPRMVVTAARSSGLTQTIAQTHASQVCFAATRNGARRHSMTNMKPIPVGV